MPRVRFTGADGMRLTFATDTTGRVVAALDLRHRQRARAEDSIRAACATGLRNQPLHDTAQNQVWLVRGGCPPSVGAAPSPSG